MMNRFRIDSDDQIDEDVAEDNQQDEQPQLNNHVNKIIKRTSESIEYILKVLQLDSARLIISLILLIVLIILQVNIEIDQNCDLKELYERAQNADLDSQKCPLESYILINLGSIFSIYAFCCLFMLLVTNIFQFVHRKHIQYIYNLLLAVYIIKECIYQNLSTVKILNEYTVIVLFSFFIFWYINEHKLGVMI